MTIRLTLLAPAPGAALREARFDDDSPLDARGHNQARAAAPGLPAAAQHLSGPSRRCRDTAEALGLEHRVEPALRDMDMGAWRGRTLTEIAAEHPDALGAWTTDPAAHPHGGESVTQLCARVSTWLDELPPNTGRTLAVVEPAVIRAAVLHALSASPDAFWRIDIPPLAVVQLTAHNGRWNLRFGLPVG